MDYTVLFFLLIITVTQTTPLHHHCNSDVYSSASGVDYLKQPTTLQYCLIDNCTIIRNDTGQQLDIVYTTQSHLVVTPTDGQTSMLISKNDPELFCFTPNTTEDDFDIIQVIGIIIITFIALVSGCIAVVHMMFKELRNTFGKLMMFSNIAQFCQCIVVIVLSILHSNIQVHTTMPCYLFNFLFMQFGVLDEAFATTFLAYLAYIMYYSYRGREVTKEINKKLYKYAVRYVLGLLLLFDIFVVGYDFGTGTYQHTLLPNGHCSFIVQSEYNTIVLLHAYGYTNEFIQMLLLVTFFVYNFKLNKMLTIVRHMPSTDTQQNRLLFKIALTMGTTLGISQIVFASSWFFDSEFGIQIAGLFIVIQQCVIMSLFVCSKKTSRLCKERFCTTETSS